LPVVKRTEGSHTGNKDAGLGPVLLGTMGGYGSRHKKSRRQGRRLLVLRLQVARLGGPLQERHHQECNDVDDLDERIDRRASRIFVRVADGVTGHSRFVSV